MEKIRINHYISKCGYCSRREADRIIIDGKVKINDKIASLGDLVSNADKVFVNGQLIEIIKKNSYYVLNKPIGIECTTNLSIKDNVISYLNIDKKIFPVGRLDKNSRGLLILTDDGDLSNKILKSKNNYEKEYIVEVNKNIDDKFINSMSNGVPILDTITKKCVVEYINKRKFRIILTQGLNRQIRRMCEYFGYKVVDLNRVRILNIKLNDLKIGEFRKLSIKEINNLKSIVD